MCGATKIVRPFGLALFVSGDWFGSATAPARLAPGRGSIARSSAGKFTFRRATMIYLDNPAAGAKYELIKKTVFVEHGLFCAPN